MKNSLFWLFFDSVLDLFWNPEAERAWELIFGLYLQLWVRRAQMTPVAGKSFRNTHQVRCQGEGEQFAHLNKDKGELKQGAGASKPLPHPEWGAGAVVVLLWPSPVLCFLLEKGKENHYWTPKIPGKEGKNAQKKKRKSSEMQKSKERQDRPKRTSAHGSTTTPAPWFSRPPSSIVSVEHCSSLRCVCVSAMTSCAGMPPIWPPEARQGYGQDSSDFLRETQSGSIRDVVAPNQFFVPKFALQTCHLSEKCKALIFLKVWSFYSHALLILSADDLGDFSGIL